MCASCLRTKTQEKARPRQWLALIQASKASLFSQVELPYSPTISAAPSPLPNSPSSARACSYPLPNEQLWATRPEDLTPFSFPSPTPGRGLPERSRILNPRPHTPHPHIVRRHDNTYHHTH